jgi:hypothetical protein
MRRRSIEFLLILVFEAALPAYAQGSVGNIVVNGDFEDIVNHTFAPWHGHMFVVNGPSRAASGGNFAIAIDAPDPLYQDLLTTPGTVYELRFAFGGNDAVQINRGGLIVRWGNTTLASLPVLLSQEPSWRYYAYFEEATDTKTRLSFSSDGFPWIDDVSVVAVPEPTAFILLSVASTFFLLSSPRSKWAHKD